MDKPCFLRSINFYSISTYTHTHTYHDCPRFAPAHTRCFFLLVTNPPLHYFAESIIYPFPSLLFVAYSPIPSHYQLSTFFNYSSLSVTRLRRPFTSLDLQPRSVEHSSLRSFSFADHFSRPIKSI